MNMLISVVCGGVVSGVAYYLATALMPAEIPEKKPQQVISLAELSKIWRPEPNHRQNQEKGDVTGAPYK